MGIFLLIVGYIVIAVLSVVVNIFAKRSDRKLLWAAFFLVCFAMGSLGMLFFEILGGKNTTTHYTSGMSMDDFQMWWIVAAGAYGIIANIIGSKIYNK